MWLCNQKAKQAKLIKLSELFLSNGWYINPWELSLSGGHSSLVQHWFWIYCTEVMIKKSLLCPRLLFFFFLNQLQQRTIMTILNAAEVEGGEVGVLIKLLHNSELIWRAHWSFVNMSWVSIKFSLLRWKKQNKKRAVHWYVWRNWFPKYWHTLFPGLIIIFWLLLTSRTHWCCWSYF